ncbi:MAG TPA: subclass B3 metallo-beta-lactamase [Pyrinomonadaceae bacterium]|nr:subclass B3 metallo-beta-lactamase [Pyrinomonadaceae bacterium]
MKVLASVLLSAVAVLSVFTQQTEEDRNANRPVKPFRIIGNVYYVGASEVTSFLITTPKGHLLIDSGFAETVPQIRENLITLGFKLDDVKVLLNTQAHYDHAGGLAELKRLTKAKLIASVRDANALAKGGRDDFTWGDRFAYEPVTVDKVVTTNSQLKFGGITLTAILTPGHTKGCTMWVLDVKEKGRRYRVAFVGSTSSPGYKLLENEKYPTIVADYEMTFSLMKMITPDIFLASHGSFFNLLEKAEAIRNNPSRNPFLDREGYKAFVRDSHKAFREKLAAEKKAKASMPKPRPRTAPL